MSSTEAALLDKINEVLGRIDARTTELQHSINAKLPWLPGPARDKVVAGWHTFCGFLERIWANLHEIISNMGSLSALWSTADAWSDRVGAPVSGQVQSADAGLLDVDTTWDGDAAEAYRQTLPLQKAALEKVKSALTDGIATALNDLARGILACWGGLVTALVTLIVGIVGALASTATIVGLPAGPVIAAGAGLVAAGAIIVGAETLKAVASSADTTLRQKLADNSGFHEGHWPPAARA
ncbi:WXG100 family type VII secretion target [Actinoplanes sp. NPDC049599]|uniref:WXG100 family type VII secretion target n=1 Tax=Actinoplanes sp. NPDC049599 TaxID=3363903 RepID=UPI0037993373